MVVSSVSPERWLITTPQPASLRHLHGVQRFGYRPNLVQLDEHGIAGIHRDALADEFGIRGVQVIAHELRPCRLWHPP